MINILFSIAFLFCQDDVPFKPKDAFEIKFEMSFKQRPQTSSSNTIHLDETKVAEARRNNAGPLPYLILNVKILKVFPEEVKMKVYKDNNISVLNKKTTEGMMFKLDLGFTDDIKDQVSGYKHVIEFLSYEKKGVSRIVIEFDKEGNYIVNGEKLGRI